MNEKEVLRVDEAIKHIKDWMTFLDNYGWDTVQMDCSYYDKLYCCLELLIKYVEYKQMSKEWQDYVYKNNFIWKKGKDD